MGAIHKDSLFSLRDDCSESSHLCFQRDYRVVKEKIYLNTRRGEFTGYDQCLMAYEFPSYDMG